MCLEPLTPLLLLALACGDSRSADAAIDAGGDAADSGDVDTGSVDADVDAAADAAVDATVDGAADATADSATGDAAAVTHYGVVSVTDVNGAAFVGQIRGAFVASGELSLIEDTRVAIAGAPDCFEITPAPPVVPTYLDAGTLRFEGLVLADHSVMPTATGDYAFDYANLLATPDDPVTVTVPGGAEIEPMSGTVGTPNPTDGGSFTEGSTGVWTSWTAGNGDYVLLRFSTSSGSHVCQVPDTGSYLIPAPAFSPDATPTGGIIFQRVIESVTRSASGMQELHFRAIAEDQFVSG